MASQFVLIWLQQPGANELRLRFRATSGTWSEMIRLWPENGECKPAGLSLKRLAPVSSSRNSVAPCEGSKGREFICWKKVALRSTSRSCGAERRIDSRRSIFQPQQMKIATSLFYVLANLFAQAFHGRKFDFVAQPLQKMNFNLCFRIQFDRMEVEQMGFYGKRLGPECGTVPDVSY